VRQVLDKSVVSALSSIAVGHQTRLFVVLLSMWQLVVANLSGVRDVIVGSPYSGRDHPAFQDVIGCVTFHLLSHPQCLKRAAEFHSILSNT